MSGAGVWLACIAGAYVTGSIPFGVIIGRAKGVDIRQHGSRNVGATNVGRVLGRRLGLTCFGLDVLKGAGPVLVAGALTGVLGGRLAAEPAVGSIRPTDMWWWMAVGCAAIAGHMASLFLKFGGGKGVATSFGVMLAMWPLLTLPAVGALLLWGAAILATRYVSVASMLGALSVPVWYLIVAIVQVDADAGATLAYASPPLIATAALALLVVWRHRANIGRLLRGAEPRIGAKGSEEERG